MLLGQQMIVGIIRQKMRVTPVQCQDFVQPAVYLQSITNITLDAQLMS